MRLNPSFFRGRMRPAAAIATGAFAVHQSRLLVSRGGLDGHDLLERGNALLLHSVPLLAGLLLAFVTATLIRGNDSEEKRCSSRSARILTYSIGILAVLVVQDFLEAALLAGHAGDLAALFSAGGWAALPIAALFGFIAAAVGRGIEAVAVLVTADNRIEARAASTAVAPVTRRITLPAPDPIAFGFARRPPPSSLLT